MKIAMHPMLKGKWTKEQGLFPADSWMNIEADLTDIFELITTDGYATSSELFGETRGSHNFISRQLFMVDVDDGMTILDLLDNEFYNYYSCGFYATPSFTLEQHKFRILFQTEKPINNPKDATDLMRALNGVFGGDPVCKDPTRLFYGTPNCEYKELRKDIYLTDDMVQALLDDIRAEDLKSLKTASTVEHSELSDTEKEHIVHLLNQLDLRYSGMYQTWITLGWGLKSGGFRLEDFQEITRNTTASKTAQQARHVWEQGNGSISMGSVIYFLRQYYEDEEIFIQKTKEERKLDKLQRELYEKYGEKCYG